jgi:hypothetical protein
MPDMPASQDKGEPDFYQIRKEADRSVNEFMREHDTVERRQEIRKICEEADADVRDFMERYEGKRPGKRFY